MYEKYGVRVTSEHLFCLVEKGGYTAGYISIHHDSIEGPTRTLDLVASGRKCQQGVNTRLLSRQYNLFSSLFIVF